MQRLLNSLAAGIFLSLFVSQARATTFVNLSNKTVYVARGDYEAYSSQPDVTPARYAFRGWIQIRPGGVARVSSGWMYLKTRDGRALKWGNLQTMTGVIKNGKFSSAYISKRTPQTDIRNLRQRGCKTVTYMAFGKGRYTITGNAIRIRKVTHRFSHQSRSLKFVVDKFRPGGAIVGYAVNYSKRKRADVKWGIQADGAGIWYGGSIKGRSGIWYGGANKGRFVRTLAPRELAGFHGTVTIEYVK